MSEPVYQLLTSLGSGLLTGGISAATAVLAFFRDIKKRIKVVEERIGSSTDPKSGLFLQIAELETTFANMRREISSWESVAPEWVLRTVRRMSSLDLDALTRVREQLTQVERNIDRATNQVTRCVDKDEYHADSARRSEEISKLREDMAEISGTLQGIGKTLDVLLDIHSSEKGPKQ